MAKQTFVASTVLTAAQMNALQANDYNQTVSTKTASYTLVAADVGTRVVMNSASATTITVNTSIFAAGDTLFLQNINSGVCTVTAGTATVTSAGSLAIPQWGSGTLYFTSASAAIYFPSGVNATTRIGQVVSTSKLDAFTTTSTSYADVTGLSVSITPTLATSKVLVMVTLQGSQATTSDGMFKLLRDSTGISVGTAGTTTNGFGQVSFDYKNSMFSCALTFLDSPATTSATTYKVQAITGAGGTITVNRRGADLQFGGSSSITVMEVIV